MKKILVPCDFSKPAISAYRQALGVAAQSNGVVHLLHVIEPPIMNDTMLMPTLNFEEELMKKMRIKEIISCFLVFSILLILLVDLQTSFCPITLVVNL